jgi:hypothetical protein
MRVASPLSQSGNDRSRWPEVQIKIAKFGGGGLYIIIRADMLFLKKCGIPFTQKPCAPIYLKIMKTPRILGMRYTALGDFP